MELIAVGVALLAALAFAGSFVSQQHVAAQVPAERGKGLRLFLELAKSPIWWAGALGDVLGFVFQAVALGFGSVVLVQPVLVTSLVFALPLAARWNGRRIPKADAVWSVAVVAALAVFTVVGDTSRGSVTAAVEPWLWPAAVFGTALAALLVGGLATRGTAKALCFGALAGVAYGIIAPLTELTVVHLEKVGFAGLLSSWPLYVLVVLIVAGTAWQQSAFHAGSLGASLPATQVLEPLVAVVLGIWALHASLHTRGLGWAALAAAALVMAVGTVQLARSAARDAAPL
ncbi:MAG: DMT family transporter [Bifidobacteriaceae bacterium]|jgi:drug/metabolite transporter (DMT)-like permease|nr:DMT family transporter [Bifidobacteriaceae bacterium]